LIVYQLILFIVCWLDLILYSSEIFSML